MRVRHWIIGISLLPFLLQLLGWARTPLGGGLCGEFGTSQILQAFSAQALYAQFFLFGMALQVAFAFLLILIDLGLMAEDSPAVRHVYRVGLWLNGAILVLFLLTRAVGLPFPTALGWLQGDTAPLDPVSLLMAGCSLILVALLRARPPAFRPVVR